MGGIPGGGRQGRGRQMTENQKRHEYSKDGAKDAKKACELSEFKGIIEAAVYKVRNACYMLIAENLNRGVLIKIESLDDGYGRGKTPTM